jgi:hypothetical protein
MALTRRTWLNLSALWLSLAIVLGHALVPLAPSLHSRSGSAFSVFTTDVTLGPARGDDAAKARRATADRDRQLRHAGGDPAIVPQTRQPSLPATPAAPPAETVPPRLAAQDSLRPYQARAPPRA